VALHALPALPLSRRPPRRLRPGRPRVAGGLPSAVIPAILGGWLAGSSRSMAPARTT
jgi:hypothetical protein